MTRPYDPDADETALWACKRAFELELGGETGDESKADRYAAKLTERYRQRYAAWTRRCVEEEPGCLRVVDVDDRTNTDEDSMPPDEGLAGYVFVLPESSSMIWDAAVLNEIYVRPAYRGTGVADDLLTAAVDHARSQALPMDRLVLDVDPDNDRAVDFYARHGFESWGEMVAKPL